METGLDIIEEPVVEEPAVEVEAPEEAEAPVVEDGGFSLDSWLSEKNVKPEDLVKTWDTFTQKSQDLSVKEKEYEDRYKPYKELEDSFKSDPVFQDYVLKYQQKDPSEESADEKVTRVEREFRDYVGTIEMKSALDTLRQSVKQQDGYPDFDDAELLQFAAQSRTADLEAAYMKLNRDAITKAIEERTVAKFKENAKAKVETRTVGGAPVAVASLDEQSQMSDADWLARFKKK